MYLDEVLIAAEHLVNGVSIVRCQDVDSVDYFHIELDQHEVIFAEGAAAETFVDCDNRLMFHNAASSMNFFRLMPRPPGRSVRRGSNRGRGSSEYGKPLRRGPACRSRTMPTACGPLEGSLDDASHRLINGWAFDPNQPGVPVWLEVLVDDGVVGRVLANLHRPDLEHDGKGDGHHGFALWLQHGLSPLAPHVVRVRRVGDGSELPGSPRLLEARDGTTLMHSTELLPAVHAAAHATPDEAALDEFLWSLQSGINHVRQLRAERRMTQVRTWASPRAPAPASRRPRACAGRWSSMTACPIAARDAGSNAMLGHIRALIALGYQVEFVATQQIVDDAAPPRPPHGLDVVHWHQAPAVATVEEVLRRNAGAYELIYLHRLSNAFAYAGLVRLWCPRAHVLYSVADLHHVRLARQAQVLALPNLLAQARAVKQAEFLAMRSVDAVITHSRAEAEYLAREAPGARVHVVGWPVEVVAVQCAVCTAQRNSFHRQRGA